MPSYSSSIHSTRPQRDLSALARLGRLESTALTRARLSPHRSDSSSRVTGEPAAMIAAFTRALPVLRNANDPKMSCNPQHSDSNGQCSRHSSPGRLARTCSGSTNAGVVGEACRGGGNLREHLDRGRVEANPIHDPRVSQLRLHGIACERPRRGHVLDQPCDTCVNVRLPDDRSESVPDHSSNHDEFDAKLINDSPFHPRLNLANTFPGTPHLSRHVRQCPGPVRQHAQIQDSALHIGQGGVRLLGARQDHRRKTVRWPRYRFDSDLAKIVIDTQ